MSNSTDKMNVEIVPMPGADKPWVKVTLKQYRSFFPSFEDLFRIIQAIGFCENEKYPDGQGEQMVADFLQDAVYEHDWEELARKYNIPIRDGNHVVDTNGANFEREL